MGLGEAKGLDKTGRKQTERTQPRPGRGVQSKLLGARDRNKGGMHQKHKYGQGRMKKEKVMDDGKVPEYKRWTGGGGW